VLFQIPVQERADPEVDAEPRRHILRRWVVGEVRLDRTRHDRMDDVYGQSILTEYPKKGRLPAPAVADQDITLGI